MAIVSWLSTIAGADFRTLLYLPSKSSEMDGPALTLLFMYGNLFCYVASYPVLCFHATRVIDFGKNGWPKYLVLDGYISTITLGAILIALSLLTTGECRAFGAYIFAICFSILQLRRISIALFGRIAIRGLAGQVSPMYGFAYSLARRRGVSEEIKTENPPYPSRTQTEEPSEEEEIKEEIHKVISWRRELVDTYRHLREHGNTAFIFILELNLAALCFAILSTKGWSSSQQLSAIGILFGIWALPSMFVHLIGQHLEHRFSWYGRRTND
jgi:hypothetical protein